jgi:hypothetical protein
MWSVGYDGKLYPRYVEGVRDGMWSDQQTLPALCGSVGMCGV